MNDERVDALRQQLRSLGYLDAGVDRFLLASASGARGPVALAARAGVRVGLLAAVLLGPAAAIGIGARLPGLINGVGDAAVIAVYLAIFFFLAITATSFVVSLAATAFGRARDEQFGKRVSFVSRTAGWITTVACLLYLTLWWRNANAGFGWSAPVWTVFALIVAVGISLLMGHAVRIATLAVVAARDAHETLPPMAARSWRGVGGGAALAFTGAGLLLILAAPSSLPVPAPSLTVIPTGMRLLVIAIDGFDLNTYLNHDDAGTLFSNALHAPTQIAVQDTADPARAWTTIATGMPPEAHGVHGIETRRVAGLRGLLPARSGPVARLLADATDLVRLTRPALTSRDARRVKTIWEVAEDAGLRTAVINWWATWPAAGKGVVVSDRALVRLEKGGALDAEITPASLYEPLRAQWPEIRRRSQAQAAAAFADVSDPELRGILIRSAELDASVIELLHALPGPPRDLDLVYLPGLDIAQHAVLARDASISPSTSALAARVAGVGLYYEFLQRLVEPLLHVERRQMAMVVTQPGRVATPLEGYVATLDSESASERTVRSGDVTTVSRQSRSSGAGTPLDIAPTIAYALGLPLSRELAGQPLQNVFAAEFVAAHPIRQVQTYGPPLREATPRRGQPLDQEAIDRLRSLGYIK